MGNIISKNNENHDSINALLLLSYDERHSIVRLLDRGSVIEKFALIKDPRSQAAACEAYLSGITAPRLIAKFVMERFNSAWSDTLDLERIGVRFIYERMYEASSSREVPGFRQVHLDVINRELTAKSTSFEIACSLWRLQRRISQQTGHDSAYKKKMPELHLDQNRLPYGIKLSRLVSRLRPYEPVFLYNERAYPVSLASTMLPREDVGLYAKEIGSWMSENWPEALDVCDEANNRLPGYMLDPINIDLAAEAFARGYLVEEAADFIFEQRIRQEVSFT